MASWLSTEHIGPLTGSPDQDPQPLQDTTRWGVNGVDEGVSVLLGARTYIYFGDIKDPNSPDDHWNFPDLIAWTDDPHIQTHGGHLALGYNFTLPNSNQQGGPVSTQQGKWWYCFKCNAIFFSQTGTDGTCPYDYGPHERAGYEFYLPNREEGANLGAGQSDWHICGNCNGLCFAPNMVPTGSCPAGNGIHSPIGWTFVLPNDTEGAAPTTGQPDWRYCGHCKSLFFDGYAHKGVCPSAPGGGLRLTPVVDSGTQENGHFFPFTGDPLVSRD